MPAVTVLDRPSGAPRATTGCPISTLLDEPNGIAGSEDFPSTCTTARSVGGSRPVMDAVAVDPSLKRTSMVPPLAARVTTWLLVRM